MIKHSQVEQGFKDDLKKYRRVFNYEGERRRRVRVVLE